MTPPDYTRIAWIEVKLHREHLAAPDERPALKDCVWVENIPCGPSSRGTRRLGEIQKHYGMCHVTTGNACVSDDIVGLPSGVESVDAIQTPEENWVCGVYVQESAYEDAQNPLRVYLS